MKYADSDSWTDFKDRDKMISRGQEKRPQTLHLQQAGSKTKLHFPKLFCPAQGEKMDSKIDEN